MEGGDEIVSSSTLVEKSLHHFVSHPARIEVVKFNGKNNFGMWKCEVMDALCALNLEDVIDEEEKPEEISEKEWIKMNRNACGLIRNCLSQDIKYAVMTETSAGKLWKFLDNKYLTKSVENRLHMKRRLYRFQMQRGISIDEHLNDFTKLLADLLNLDEELEDEDKALLLLNSLPDEFENFTMTLIHGKEALKYEEVTAALLNYEFRRRDKESTRVDSAQALTLQKGRSEKRKSSLMRNSGKSNGDSLGRNQCAYCLESGHWKKDCPKLKETKASGSSKASVHVAQNLVEASDSDVSLVIVPMGLPVDNSIWIMDTGATFHICPHKDWFCSYRTLDSGAVIVGNDDACRIAGIGGVLIKAHDGTIQELLEVRHVPEIKKNILSIGALEAKGYEIAIETGVLEIKKGTVTYMRGVRRNGLYYLQGSTVTGSFAVEENTDDAMVLWHMGLAHDNESSIGCLVKNGELC